MQKKYTPQELQKMFVALPEDIKDAIFSLDVTERINVIGKRSGLTVEQLGELGSEVGLVLLGATRVADFVSNLAERLKISKDSAVKLAEYINAEIFSPTRESLKKVQGVEDIRFSSGAVGAEKLQPLQPLKEIVPLPKKEDILGEIEKGEEKNLPAKVEEKEIIPDIFKGMVAPNPFEVKNEQAIFRNPPQKTDYPKASLDNKQYPAGADPYRELPQ